MTMPLSEPLSEPPDDVADRIIDFIEDSGGRVEIWQANLIRQWWGGPRRCIKCRKPIDSGGRYCGVCKYIAEREAERQKDKPTSQLLETAASLIDTLVRMHPEYSGGTGTFVLGQDWQHLVRQLRSGAKQ